MRAGRVSRRHARPAREDRHGVAEHEHARPGALPHPARDASPHRRRVVHLSDLRLRAPVSDAIEGITHSICTLEFEEHRPLYDWVVEHVRQTHVAAAADRVRAAQPDLHRDEQAQAARAGGAEARRRLGRSAHADDRRHAAARLHARGDPRLLRRASASRRRTTSSTSRCSSTRVREDLNRRAPRALAVLRPLKVVIENYPEGQRRAGRRPSTIPRIPAAGTRTCRSRARSTSSATTSWRFRRRSSSASRRARSAAALRLHHQVRARS